MTSTALQLQYREAPLPFFFKFCEEHPLVTEETIKRVKNRFTIERPADLKAREIIKRILYLETEEPCVSRLYINPNNRKSYFDYSRGLKIESIQAMNMAKGLFHQLYGIRAEVQFLDLTGISPARVAGRIFNLLRYLSESTFFPNLQGVFLDERVRPLKSVNQERRFILKVEKVQSLFHRSLPALHVHIEKHPSHAEPIPSFQNAPCTHVGWYEDWLIKNMFAKDAALYQKHVPRAALMANAKNTPIVTDLERTLRALQFPRELASIVGGYAMIEQARIHLIARELATRILSDFDDVYKVLTTFAYDPESGYSFPLLVNSQDKMKAAVLFHQLYRIRDKIKVLDLRAIPASMNKGHIYFLINYLKNNNFFPNLALIYVDARVAEWFKIHSEADKIGDSVNEELLSTLFESGCTIGNAGPPVRQVRRVTHCIIS